MYNADSIKTCFAGLVGFRQSDDPSYPTIDTSLTTSTSGKYLQSVHPLCSIENIVNVGPEFHNYVYPDWTSGNNYNKGARVLYTNDLIYRAKAAITNSVVAPDTDNTNWEAIDPFSEWLKEVYNDACINLVMQYITQRKIQEKAKSLLELSELFQGPGSVYMPILGQSRFVGIEVSPRTVRGLTQDLKRLGFQSTKPQDELIFYVYHSSQSEPIFEMPIIVAANASFGWTALTDKIIGYMHNNVDAEGVYYIGYYEDDLVTDAQAIRKEINFHAGCASCNSYDFWAYNQWSKYCTIKTIEVPAVALRGDKTLFDTSKVRYAYDTNWGMNLGFSVFCDYTTVFCENKAVFADALSMQLALEFINKIAFTTRIGAIADNTKKLAMAELATKENSGSFTLEYYKVLQALDIDMSGLDGACLPCNKKNRLSIGSI